MCLFALFVVYCAMLCGLCVLALYCVCVSLGGNSTCVWFVCNVLCDVVWFVFVCLSAMCTLHCLCSFRVMFCTCVCFACVLGLVLFCV